MTFPRYPAGDSRNVCDQYVSEFKEIFGVDLERFWGVQAFDLLGFADATFPGWMDGPQGPQSVGGLIKEKFGRAGMELIDVILRDVHCGDIGDE